MKPNFNKIKFLKIHRKKRLINLGKGNKGKSLSIYKAGVYVSESIMVTSSQLEAVRKYITKRLKNKDKTNRKNFKLISSGAKKTAIKKKKKTDKKEKIVIVRHNFNLGLTKKPLQVRMGKGKGAPVDWVYPCAKNRIFLEFRSKKVKQQKIKKLINKAQNKLPIKLKFWNDEKKKISNIKKIGLINYPTKIKCILEP